MATSSGTATVAGVIATTGKVIGALTPVGQVCLAVTAASVAVTAASVAIIKVADVIDNMDKRKHESEQQNYSQKFKDNKIDQKKIDSIISS